jgi:AbiV family abortive infection protein
MEARQIKRLMSRPIAERESLIVEGLGALLEHVTTLNDDLTTLVDANGIRGAAVVGMVAEEEAAKVLILLDLVRMGWSDDKACSLHLAKFTDHLARGIYVEMASFKPGSFREVMHWVDRERRSHYLDGPNDVDWSFRNDIETRREESIYVDYIATDEGDRWVTPAQREEFSEHWPTPVIELVLGLGKCGVLTSQGLRNLRKAWDGVVVDEDTQWSDVLALNLDVLRATAPDPLPSPLTRGEARALREYWTFPMHQLEMKKVQVTRAERARQQQAWLGSQYL